MVRVVHKDTSHITPYCPISSTLPHTFTTPTTTTGQLPNSFWPTFVAIAANTFLTRMHFFSLKALAPSINTTLATNSDSRNRSLSHEPKTHSPPPPPPSLSAKQAAQAIQSSPLALFPPLPHTTPYTTRALHIVFGNVFALRTFAPQSGAPCKRYKYKSLSLTCTPGWSLGMFSYFAP